MEPEVLTVPIGMADEMRPVEEVSPPPGLSLPNQEDVPLTHVEVNLNENMTDLVLSKNPKERKD